MQLPRARQPCLCRSRRSVKLIVDAVDEERAQEVVGGEVGDAETDNEEGDGDDENASAERHRLPRQPQAVTNAAHRVDQLRLLEVDLLAQMADVALDDAEIAPEVIAPDVVNDLRLRDHPPRVQ